MERTKKIAIDSLKEIMQNNFNDYSTDTLAEVLLNITGFSFNHSEITDLQQEEDSSIGYEIEYDDSYESSYDDTDYSANDDLNEK